MSISTKIVDKMFNQDAFSQWLGIEIVDLSKGYCKLKMKVRGEMLNGFHIAHGGIAYSLADSALAFASNSNGKKSLSVETSISHAVAIKKGRISLQLQKNYHFQIKLVYITFPSLIIKMKK